MNENPLVTVNILSFNRKDELRNTLTKVYEQDYKNIEVIVVDNASADGSSEMVKKEFPGVQLIQLEKNIGIAGWNEGFKVAKGEYVLVLDDDSYPESGAILEAIKAINMHLNVGIFSMQVYNTCWNNKEELNFINGELCVFTGCGALITKKCLQTVGYYEESLFLYLHEIEYIIRLFKYNIGSITSNDSYVVHHYSPSNRSTNYSKNYDSRKHYYFLRNKLLILILHFPLSLIFFFCFKITFYNFIFSIKNREWHFFFNAYFDAYKIILRLIKKRQPLKYYEGRYFAKHF